MAAASTPTLASWISSANLMGRTDIFALGTLSCAGSSDDDQRLGQPDDGTKKIVLASSGRLGNMELSRVRSSELRAVQRRESNRTTTEEKNNPQGMTPSRDIM